MKATTPDSLYDKLQNLRTELVDLAFRLECLGQVNAAEVAIATSTRLNELCDEIACEPVDVAV